MNIYREVVAYINSHKPGTSFTTKDFHKHMASLGYRDSYQPHYRVNTYRTYLGSAGFITQVRRGEWMTVYVIPEWVTLKMLETARGYGRGCNKVVMREAQDKIAAYFAEQKKTEKIWKIGDQFKVLSATVYTIEVSDMKDRVKITWVDDRGDNDSMLYDVADLDEYFSKGSWKLIEKTNIQENVSPAQKDSVDLQHTKTQTTMTKKIVYCIDASESGVSPALTVGKGYEVIRETNPNYGTGPRYVIINNFGREDEFYQYRFTTENPNKQMTKPTTLPVSPAFIVEAHKVACGTWKAKLEQMYPSVFRPTQKFKVGDKIQFPASAAFPDDTYILADVGKGHIVLINLQSGSRWNDQLHVANTSAITAEEMQKICGSQKLETILVNGTTPTMATKWSKEKTLTAKISDIKAAYEATSDANRRKMIKDYFPEAFGRYVKFVESSGQTVTLSPYTTTIDGADFVIGRGLAPRPELEGACIGVHADKVEVEVITSGKMTWVAFKKK